MNNINKIHLHRKKEKEQLAEIRKYLPITKRYNKKISDIDVVHLLCMNLKTQAHLQFYPLNEHFDSKSTGRVIFIKHLKIFKTKKLTRNFMKILKAYKSLR